jgi:hypothetical protein
MNWREGLSRLDHGPHNLLASYILSAIKVGGQTCGQGVKGRPMHRLSFLSIEVSTSEKQQ